MHCLARSLSSFLAAAATLLFSAAPVLAQGPTPTTYGSSGSDGDLVVPAGGQVLVDLATQGTFDPLNWVVRFDYTSVQLGAGSTLLFANHPSRAPVAWVVSGDVQIAPGARVFLAGQDGSFGGPLGFAYAEPGPGGFRGGRGSLNGTFDNTSAGLGPGGGKGDPTLTNYGGTGGSYRIAGAPGEGASSAVALAEAYGGPGLTQLVGGSGGGAGRRTLSSSALGGGGAGGGALLIAADGAITLDGLLDARGGRGADAAPGGAAGGGGAGGALRLASLTSLQFGPDAQILVAGGPGGAGIAAGPGSAPAGGAGGSGRIRLEAPGAAALGNIPDSASTAAPGPLFPSVAPPLWISSIGGQPVAPDADLGAALSSDPDFFFPDVASVAVVVSAPTLPEGSLISLRVSRASGPALELGPLSLGAGQTSVTFPSVPAAKGITALQARAVLAGS
jgi:hypothetical protein